MCWTKNLRLNYERVILKCCKKSLKTNRNKVESCWVSWWFPRNSGRCEQSFQNMLRIDENTRLRLCSCSSHQWVMYDLTECGPAIWVIKKNIKSSWLPWKTHWEGGRCGKVFQLLWFVWNQSGLTLADVALLFWGYFEEKGNSWYYIESVSKECTNFNS